MNDTISEVAQRFQKMIMQRSPEERLRMGCSMYDAAKQIVKSSIIEQHPQISPEAMRGKIFLRFYEKDFDMVQKKKILSYFNHEG